MADWFSVGVKKIGFDQPCFVIAEAGVNHNGDIGLACQLIDAARTAGADAVKFQTFTAERLVSASAPKAEYQKQRSGDSQSQYEMLKQLELSADDFRLLQQYCQQRDILFLSSPFDEESVDLLEALDMAAYKVPSGEITNTPLLKYIAATRKPVLMSTGMAYLGEVETAMQMLYANGAQDIALFHCVSNYPANPDEINLRAMETLRHAFRVPVGYSDHTNGSEIPLAAVALGAKVLEKHFTLDRTLPGPDHQASLEPSELVALVRGVRMIEAALGDGRKRPVVSETAIAAVARKSYVAAVDLPEGATLTDGNLVLKRPGTGLPASSLPYLIGRTTRVAIAQGTIISLDMLS
jgi:N,N'-diacetyllegionaminate synthase